MAVTITAEDIDIAEEHIRGEFSCLLEEEWAAFYASETSFGTALDEFFARCGAETKFVELDYSDVTELYFDMMLD